MTAMIINPGSGSIAAAGEGWTNTETTARAEAGKWLTRMHTDGMTDVELLDGCTEREGRWVFRFRHKVTGAVVELEAHGIDDFEAYRQQRIFEPRVYWNGSSTAEPKLEDFAAPGFVVVRTFTPEADR